MESALSAYAGIAMLTFIWILMAARPNNLAAWLTLVAISVLWPPFLLWVLAGERGE